MQPHGRALGTREEILTESEQRTIAKVKRRILPLLMAGAIACFLDRVNVSFAALGMMKDLGLTATVYGFGAGLFFVPYLFFEVPSNIILARVGARLWFARIMFTWGLVAGAMAFVVGEYSFYTMRVLLAIAEAGFYPGVIYFLSIWFPLEYRGRIVGIFSTAFPIATVLGAPISGFILDLDGMAGLKGWQWLFLIEAIPSLVLAVVFFIYLPEKPETATWLEPEERAWLVKRVEADKAQSPIGHQSIWRALSLGRVFVLGLILFSATVQMYALSFFAADREGLRPDQRGDRLCGGHSIPHWRGLRLCVGKIR